MKSFDRLQITFNTSIETFNSISKILGIKPTNENSEFLNENRNSWEYENIERDDDDYYDFINKFIDIFFYVFRIRIIL